MNELKINGIETAIGTQECETSLVINFKDGVSDKVMTAVSAQAMEMVNAYNSIARGYFQLLSPLARFIKSKGYQSVKDCKSPSQFLIKLLGCSKGTASELSRVATKFYNSDGEPSHWCENFTYSELTKLLEYDDDGIQAIKDRLGDGKHTRAELLKSIADYNADKELERQGIETNASDDSSTGEPEPETAEGAENEASTEGETAENSSTVEPKEPSVWLESDKIKKLMTELTACSKGKKTKTEMQEIAFRALQTIKAYEGERQNPFTE